MDPLVGDSFSAMFGLQGMQHSHRLRHVFAGGEALFVPGLDRSPSLRCLS